jgi:hypothetical protein
MLKVMRWDNDDAITHDALHIVTTVTLDHIVTVELGYHCSLCYHCCIYWFVIPFVTLLPLLPLLHLLICYSLCYIAAFVTTVVFINLLTAVMSSPYVLQYTCSNSRTNDWFSLNLVWTMSFVPSLKLYFLIYFNHHEYQGNLSNK